MIALSLNGWGQPKTWTGVAGDGLWTTASNWNNETLPIPTDDVILDNTTVSGNYTVTIDGATVQTVKSLQIGYTGNPNTIEVIVSGSENSVLTVKNGGATALHIMDGGVLSNQSTSGTRGIKLYNNSDPYDVFKMSGNGKYIHVTTTTGSGIPEPTSNPGSYNYDFASTSIFENQSGSSASFDPNPIYGNYVYNTSAGKSAAVDLVINGQLTISQGELGVCASTTNVFTIAGSVEILDGATFRGSSTTGNATINVNGSVIGAGIFAGSTNSSATTTMNVGGSISTQISFNTGSNTLNFSGGESVISFTPANNDPSVRGFTVAADKTVNLGATLTIPSTYTININSGGTLSTNVGFTNNGAISVNGTLNCGDYVISGAGNFTLASGATLKTANSSGINGSITVVGTKTFDNAANYEFNGSSAQVTGTLLPTVVNNLTIDNPAGLKLSNTALTVSGNMTINNGKLFTLESGKELTISGTLTNNAGSSGLLIESTENGTGSLINSSAGVNATVQRYLSKYDAAGDSKYHFISSPVATQEIFTDLTDLYRYSEVTNYWINRTSSGDPEAFGDENFVVGRGYLVANVADVTKEFTGSLNSYLTDSPLVLTGTNTPDKGDGWNLFGNPFPSAIDWDGVAKGNGMDNALYYYDAAAQNYLYYINIDGVVGSGSRYIPAMQGFMVHAKSAGTTTISIDNGDRVHEAQTVFYKAATAIPGSLSLKVSAGDYEDVAFVHFNEGATTQFDGAYDAYKLSSYNTLVPMIYTQSSNNEDLAINGLPELTEELAIPVYFVPGTEGIQTLTANLEGLTSTVVYLKDNKTNTTQNLAQNPIYSFTATEGDNPDRFLLHFGIVGIEDNTSNLNQINAYAYQNQLYVQSNLNEAQVSLYDIQGHQLLSREINGAGSSRIPLDLPSGIYIVRLQSNNQVKNVKVFIN